MIMTEEKQLYTIQEVMAILRLSESTVRLMIKDKQLDATKVRGQWRIKKSSVDKHL